jgi:hypothetical protein
MKLTSYRVIETRNETINNNNIVIEKIEKTINVGKSPFINSYYTLTVNGEGLGSNEVTEFELDWHLKNNPIIVGK